MYQCLGEVDAKRSLVQTLEYQNLGKRKTDGFYFGDTGSPILRVACSTNIKTNQEKENLIQSYPSERNVLDLRNSTENHFLSTLCG